MNTIQKLTQFVLILICLFPALSKAQVGINTTGNDPDSSAILDVSSTDKGMLIPRMTEAQRDQISNPADGLMVYVTDDSSFHYFDGRVWTSMKSSAYANAEELQDSTWVLGDCENIVDIIPPTYIFNSWANRQWQSITADKGGFLCGFRPQIGTSNSFKGGYFRIYEGQGTSGNLIYEKTIAAMSSADYIDIPADSIYFIQGHEYTFLMEDSIGNFGWGRVNNAYAGGISRYSEVVRIPSWDLAFALDIKSASYLVDFNQRLSLSGNELSISNGNTVDLNVLYQSLALNPDSLLISDGGGVSMDNLEEALFSQKIIGLEVPDVVQTVGGSSITNNILNQSWTATRDAYLSKFLWVNLSGNKFKGGYVSLYNGANDLIIRFLVEASASTEDTISFDGLNIILEQAQQYRIILQDTIGNFGIQASRNNPYAGGEAYAGGLGSGYDHKFKVFVNPIVGVSLLEQSSASSWNINHVDSITASTFIGDGSQLTNLPIPSAQTLSINGSQLSISSGNTVSLPLSFDNLGSHQATQNLLLDGNWLTNDGGNEGIYIDTYGRVGIGKNAPAFALDVAGDLQLENDDPRIVFREEGNGTSRKSYINTILNTATSAGEDNKMEFLVSSGTTNGFSEVMVLQGNGRVGIGTGSSSLDKAILEVKGTVGYSLGNFGFHNSNGDGGTSSGQRDYSVYASGLIAAIGFHAHSDMRIKQIEGHSDSKTDLATLMQIEVTDYRMRDSITQGSKAIKKVIAQQVAEVYPQAVTTTLTEVVPDIYQRAEVQDGWIMLATNLKAGERVKIITEQSADIYEVTAVEESRFQVSNLSSLSETISALSSHLFVYGREVDDFHTVDYEALSMLNVSATQEQQRRIEMQQDQIEMLKQENAKLSNQLQQLQGLEARLQALEASLQLNK